MTITSLDRKSTTALPVLILTLLGAVSPALAAQAEVSAADRAEIFWIEDFESGWNGWFPDNGVWDVGVATWGPSVAHSGQNVAGTILNGDYPGNCNTRLICPAFTVPAAHDMPRLKFYQWFSLGANDRGWVQISVDYGNWVTLSGTFDNVSWAWSPCMVDLSEYAGESVRIAFYFTSDVYFPGAGWYIDDVSVITGDYSRNLALETEDFEDGDGDWWADNGLWQVGQPSYGLAAGHSGLKCAGTILHGEYPGQANTRWVTPPFTVPSADQNPRWKMFNWHHMGANDNGWVQISVDGGEWTTIGGPFDNTSAAWTQYLVGLSPYAGQSVRMGLFFTTDVYFPGIGWFVDDVVVASGPWQVRNPEDFEAGHGDWSADNGVWELGVPAYGPAAAHSGENCMGTLIGAESPGEANSRLISPPCTVSGPGENPHVWFYHWYQMGANDRGWIQISVDYGDWQTVIAEPFDDSNPTWTPYMVPLSDYSGHSVRVAFLFTSDVYFPGAGWYIDDFSFEPYVATAKKSWSGLKAGYR